MTRLIRRPAKEHRRYIRPSALKRLKQSFRSDTLILGPMTRHVMRKQNETDYERNTGMMHPSDLAKADWCGRRDYYTITGAKSEKAKLLNPSFTMENILTEGTNIHRKYQTWLWEMGVLWGAWLCRVCEYYWEALAPTACPNCGSSRLRYREVPLVNDQYLIGGHADGAVEGRLIEIKSIGIRTLAFEAPRLYQRYLDGTPAEEIWFQINRPFPSHLRQGLLYLWLSQGRYEEIVFIYESKFTQQTKEFLVRFNPAIIEGRLEEAREVAQSVRALIPPDRPLWAAADGPICQSCPYRRICWSIHDEKDPQDQSIPVIKAKRAKRRRALQEAGLRHP